MSQDVDRFSYVISGHEELTFEPLATPEAGGGGGEIVFGEMATLRRTGYNGNPHIVGFWRVEPAVSPLYDVPLGDESGYVISGSATIEFIDSGEKLELKAGEMYSMAKGTLQRWTVHEPFIKFVVVSDGPAARS
jgi:uncharacterized cupin superfamily protein